MLEISEGTHNRNGILFSLSQDSDAMKLFIARDNSVPCWHWRMTGLAYRYLPPDYIIDLRHFDTMKEALNDYNRFSAALSSLQLNDFHKITHNVNGISWYDYIYEIEETETIYIVPNQDGTWQWGIDFTDESDTIWSCDKEIAPWSYPTPSETLSALKNEFLLSTEKEPTL